ncbi:beta-1,3-galactosyltransferase 1 [Aplysia californica]|uniref:Hexosyltransferase n=1 Tax=Aplysia californica TaxID=6500 RepID=A0ABM0JMF0_APLCA|nr:beta-1,3-galactosyltransferase 1 [Aplysia californica]
MVLKSMVSRRAPLLSTLGISFVVLVLIYNANKDNILSASPCATQNRQHTRNTAQLISQNPFLNSTVPSEKPASASIPVSTSSRKTYAHIIQETPPNAGPEQGFALEYLDQEVQKAVETKKAAIRLLSSPIINQHNMMYLVGREQKCTNMTPEVIITVPSGWGNFEKRQKVRDGPQGKYVRAHSQNALLLFFVGLPPAGIGKNKTQKWAKLQEESEKYADVVIAYFEDKYRNILFKHLSMLQWVINFCPKAKFVLRTDDDVGVKIDSMLVSLRRHSDERQNFILGKQRVGDAPSRREERPHYYLSEEEYEPDTFPPYVLGGAIGYPVSTVKLLYEVARRTKNVWLDDVFMTGICAAALGIPTFNERSFQFTH